MNYGGYLTHTKQETITESALTTRTVSNDHVTGLEVLNLVSHDNHTEDLVHRETDSRERPVISPERNGH